MIWQDLGISAGTAIMVLIAFYFVIKHGVKNGIRSYFAEKEEEEEYMRQHPELYDCKTETATTEIN